MLNRFIAGTKGEYAQPLDHRAKLLELAADIGRNKRLPAREVAAFQEIISQFNRRD